MKTILSNFIDSSFEHVLHSYDLRLVSVWNMRIKAWFEYPKRLFHFIFIGPPYLNMLLKLNDKFILKV
jgi:hypothetical protein